MDKEAMFLISIVIGIAIFGIQQFWFPIPDFSEGQCIAHVYEAKEFKPRSVSRIFSKIVKVGRYNYMTMGYVRDNDGEVDSSYSDFDTITIQFESNYTQVDCETGLEL